MTKKKDPKKNPKENPKEKKKDKKKEEKGTSTVSPETPKKKNRKRKYSEMVGTKKEDKREEVLIVDISEIFNKMKRNKNTEETFQFFLEEDEEEEKQFDEKLPEKFLKKKDLKLLNNIEGLLEICQKYKKINNKDIIQLIKIEPELQELNDMIGLKEVKKMICSQILYVIQNSKNEDMMHTVLYGLPGCGKTTLGKILGKIFLRIGYLKNNKFIIAKRSDLIAGYLGQTAIKTQKIIDKASGGVLFIDEVYSLGSDSKNTDSFSKECIDTLNQNLSENRKFICIIAGYEDDVKKCFFKKNAGLERRFPWVYKIDEITGKQLNLIFLSFLKKNKWNFDKLELKELEKFFNRNRDDFPFNGGSIETFFSKLKINYYQVRFGRKRLKRDKKTINMEDILKTFEIYKKYENKRIEKNLPPPGMYI
jgi:SpoVK/Ycf46/Vps4 family AAA+-type ATPase